MLDNTILTYIGIGLALIFIPIIFLSKSLDWIPFKIFRVRGSHGKLLLVRKRLPVHNRYYVAKMIGEDAIWDEKEGLFSEKKEHRVTVLQQGIHTEYGCKIIEIDSNGKLYCPSDIIVSGFDAEHLQDLLNREAEKPPETNATENLKLILAFGTILLTLLVGYLTFKNSQKLDLLVQQGKDLANILVNNTVHNI